jgi:hypothetical protein
MVVERVVDANGVQVGTGRVREPQQKVWHIILSTDDNQRWRIASAEPAIEPVIQP